MLKVFKYPILVEDYQILELPKGARILSFNLQAWGENRRAENLFIWALVDPDAETELRYFRLAGTGHPINHEINELEFIGTVMIEELLLVFHLFEIKTTR